VTPAASGGRRCYGPWRTLSDLVLVFCFFLPPEPAAIHGSSPAEAHLPAYSPQLRVGARLRMEYLTVTDAGCAPICPILQNLFFWNEPLQPLYAPPHGCVLWTPGPLALPIWRKLNAKLPGELGPCPRGRGTGLRQGGARTFQRALPNLQKITARLLVATLREDNESRVLRRAGRRTVCSPPPTQNGVSRVIDILGACGRGR